jgi:hypothetical protein
MTKEWKFAVVGRNRNFALASNEQVKHGPTS